MSRRLIAFNLPPNINDDAIREAIKKDVDLSNSICNITFYNNFDHKNARITLYNKSDAEKTFVNCNHKTINEIYFDFIYSDYDVEEFLKNNKKKLYFKLHSIELKDLSDNIQKYDPIHKVHFNEKKRIGYFTFESTEKALKAQYNLKQTLSNSAVEISFESFEEFSSIFLNRAKNRNLRPFLKKGNDSSIFVFDIPQLNEKPAIDEDFLRTLFEDYKVDKSDSSVSFHKRYNYDSKLTFYAIIIFKNRENAIKVIDDLNYTKLDGVPIRLVLADDDTRNVIASNDGKLLISNLDVDIEVMQLHEAFSNFGQIVECEIPTDNGISRGYGYVHFRNIKDAKQAKIDLVDAFINGMSIEVDFIDNNDSFDIQKQFLFNENFKNVKYFKKNSDDLNSMIFNIDFSLFDHINADFVISVNENQIECSRFLASFLSPHIENNKSLSKFEIKIYRLDKGFSMVYEIANFLFSLLNRKNISKKNLQTLITKTIEKIISSMLIGNLKEQLNKTVDDCSEFLIGKIETNQGNDDFILSFIILIEIFAQFGNDIMIQYLNNLLLYNIKKNDSIENDQVLYIRNEIKKIMKDTKTEAEINYIKYNFNEMDPCILNEIEIQTIENAVKKMDHEKNEDKFLCKILRLEDNYKKHLLINYVNFEYVSNEAMKIFLSSIDFSFIDESLLNSLSVRLSFPIIQTREIDDQNIPIHFSHVMKNSIQNSILKQNFKDFTIFVNNKKIEINSIYATLISPKIKKYIQTDRTCSSFYLRFDSNQVHFFNEFVNSLSFFISKEKIDDISQIAIENQFYNHLCQINEIIESKGIAYLESFFNTLHSNEKSALNYACWVSLMIYLGNFGIAEFLINSLVRSNNQEITGISDVLIRLHHKEVLKYKNEINIDILSEKNFISNNFNDFFTNIEDFNDISEDLWIVISIRLSLDIDTKLDAKIYQ